MTTILILTGLMLLVCAIFTFCAVAEREWGAFIYFLASSIAFGIFLGIEIDIVKKGNQELVEYRFPTSHYKVEMVISSKMNTVYVNGVETVAETRDTTYVITGVEPMAMKKDNYERKVIK